MIWGARRVIGVAIAMVMLTASPALAAQRFASPGGSGSTCSEANPCAIQVAANNANPSDEVIVAPGDYSPPGNVIAPYNDIYLHGVAGQPMPRIHFAGSGFLWVGNPGDRASYLAADSSTSAPFEVSNGASADQIVAQARGANDEACFVYATLIDSICWASGADGVGMVAATTLNTTIQLRNVTLEATGSSGLGAGIVADSPASVTVNFTNVIARGANRDISLEQNSGSSLVANLDHTNHVNLLPIGSPTVNETGEQTGAPKFVNAAAGDFREAAGSPTIDAGVTSPANGAFDFLGKPRVINGATDIGGDEFDPFAGVTLGNQKSKVKKRKAKVTIGCPAPAPSPCAGTITLSFAQGKKTLRAGASAFSLAAGATETLKVKISKKAFRRLAKRHKLPTQATAAATDGAGTSATTTAKVKLKIKG